MSLQTDSAFITALSSNSDLMATVGKRLYDTYVTVPDNAINKSVPYLLVTFDGGSNASDSKDAWQNEGTEDNVTVTLEVTAKTREQLATIAQQARTVIRDYFADNSSDEEVPLQYDLQIGSVQHDDDVPCFWQQLVYQCVTNA